MSRLQELQMSVMAAMGTFLIVEAQVAVVLKRKGQGEV
jgi:hypothetical protein